MADYYELMAGHCGRCARRVIFVRVLRATWPLLYDVASAWLGTAARHAWLAGAAVRVPWECQECGSPLDAPAGRAADIAKPIRWPTWREEPQPAEMSEQPAAR